MHNQKILYSHGKKILIQFSKKNAGLYLEIERLKSLFLGLSLDVPNYLPIQYTNVTNFGHYLSGQSSLVNLDNYSI